jgi:hypothetical protein
MIEVPRAALTAAEIAAEAEFFSFGTNDLTQMTFGFSRDDSGSFLPSYVERGILPADPFQTLDEDGVGAAHAARDVERGRQGRPDLKVGLCGEHGGDPSLGSFCVDRAGLRLLLAVPRPDGAARRGAGAPPRRARARHGGGLKPVGIGGGPRAPPPIPAVMNRLLALLALLAVFAGCDSSSTDAEVFSLSAFDAEARLVLEGELRLALEPLAPEPEEATGRWQLEGRNGYPTPQPPHGAVRGEAHLGAVELRLLHEASDSGFILEGTSDGDRIAGTWSVVTIAGPVPQGSFEAVRD